MCERPLSSIMCTRLNIWFELNLSVLRINGYRNQRFVTELDAVVLLLKLRLHYLERDSDDRLHNDLTAAHDPESPRVRATRSKSQPRRPLQTRSRSGGEKWRKSAGAPPAGTLEKKNERKRTVFTAAINWCFPNVLCSSTFVILSFVLFFSGRSNANSESRLMQCPRRNNEDDTVAFSIQGDVCDYTK